MRKRVTTILLALALLLPLAPPALAGSIRISAAASMTDVVKELAVRYDRLHPGSTILPNFGSSGALAKQLQQGAPTDIFLSANQQWVDLLVTEKALQADSVRTLAGNALVLVGARGQQIAALGDLLRLKRIALGSPKSVPAGQYAEQALRTAGLYDQLAGRLVQTPDVRQALVYADRGEVEAAFVYQTDALLAQQATILYRVPADQHAPIRYPVALTPAGAANPEAVRFFKFLAGPEARLVLEQFGFVVH